MKILLLLLFVSVPARAGITPTTAPGDLSAITSSTLTIQAIDLDIRDLDSSQDSVSAVITNPSVSVDDGGTPLDVSDGGSSLTIDTAAGAIDTNITNASVSIDDGGSPVSVDDNGGSLSVDNGGISLGVTVDNASVSVDDGGTALSVEGQGFSTVSHSSASCTTSPTFLLASEATRVGTLIVNESTFTIRVGSSADLTAGLGTPVPGNFGSVSLDTNQRYFRGELYCLSLDPASGAMTATRSLP